MNNMGSTVNSLISSSSGFVGGRVIAPGPMAVPSVLSQCSTTSRGSFAGLGNARTYPAAIGTLSQSHLRNNPNASIASTSILRADMSPMVDWLTRQSHAGAGLSTQRALLASNSCSNGFEYDSSSIPKPYNQLTKEDCAGIVAQAIRTIIMHTCNDEFRQDCFTKLGVQSSHEVEREVRTRLTAMINAVDGEVATDADGSGNVQAENP